MVENLPANAEAAGDAGSIPGMGRSPGGGKCNPLQDRGAWWAIDHGVTKSDMTEHACVQSRLPKEAYLIICPI